MRDVEERAEAVLAGLPGYVWDGDVDALCATFRSSIAATKRRIASLL